MPTTNLPNILITGGSGYIGSHIAAHLPPEYNVILVDNLCNSTRAPLSALKQITGKDFTFIEADLRNVQQMELLFSSYQFDSVIHCAGLKSLAESNRDPLKYYDNNMTATITILKTMTKYNVSKILFSSSATVYGQPERLPLNEQAETGCTNPYGRTKLFVESVLRDLYNSAPGYWNIVILRYFNPVGSHESGLLGEDASGEKPNNLMPYVAKVANGDLPILRIFGNDWETPDGTGVRDYIHVSDLAEGHVAALTKLHDSTHGCETFNLGTGVGYSVLEMVQAFENASGRKVNYEFVGRRPGDCGLVYADPSLAVSALGWRAKRGLDQMCCDLWRWQSGRAHQVKQLRSADSAICLED